MRPPKLTAEQIETKRDLPIGFTLEGHLRAIDGYIDGLEVDLRERTFSYVGPMPEGYEFHIVYGADPDGGKQPVQEKVRGRRIDDKWHGPWRQPGQGALVVADTWKHVTKATNAEIDEAGSG
jgi:hypothetical protein